MSTEAEDGINRLHRLWLLQLVVVGTCSLAFSVALVVVLYINKEAPNATPNVALLILLGVTFVGTLVGIYGFQHWRDKTKERLYPILVQARAPAGDP